MPPPKGRPTAVVSTPVGDQTPLDPFRLYKLTGCHDDLKEKIGRVLIAMRALGWPMIVTDGLRTLTEQQHLYAKGRTTPGPIVTNADGVQKLSNHQSGKACDCCFYVGGQPSWDARLPWKAYGSCLEAVGLKWGGNWQSLHDLPHAELP